MEIEIHSVGFRATSCRTRLPFRFGRVTLTEAPVLVAEVTARVGDRIVIGMSADLCVPKWFEKDPRKSVRQDVLTLFASARRAATAFKGATGTPFALWHRASQRCLNGDLASGIRLVDGFGLALVERAMIDASCRGLDLSFRKAIESDALGFEPGTLLEETAGLKGQDLLASPAPERVLVRHTVGGLDALRREDVPPALVGDDDHPVCLVDDIARFGLTTFKLKAGGEPKKDVERLVEIARVVQQGGVNEPIYTLDANESYQEASEVEALLDGLANEDDGALLLDHLAYLEQPLPRERTLDPNAADSIRSLAERVPLLIDEADDDVEAFPRALDLGYKGVSVKNCKGVFRALTNRALCLTRGDGAFQTSEDLTNLPVLPLQQDLATVAALGLPHSERNGHHFFAGLDVVPKAEAESALAAHPDLYERRGERIVLKIEDGSISLACQHAIGFGYTASIDTESRPTLDAVEGEWSA